MIYDRRNRCLLIEAASTNEIVNCSPLYHGNLQALLNLMIRETSLSLLLRVFTELHGEMRQLAYLTDLTSL
ncbi:hypothetical protein WAI453_004662 [Rhynchosporium graminicola]